MKATLRRNRCLYCCLVPMDVLVDGLAVASLKNGEFTELTLPDEGAEVKVSMGKFAGSAPLAVQGGQSNVLLEAGAKTWPLFDVFSLSYMPSLKDKVLYVRTIELSS